MSIGRRLRVRSRRAVIGVTTGLGLLACVGVATGFVTWTRETRGGDPSNVYRFSDRPVEFLDFPGRGLVISKGCRDGAGKLACNAYDAFKRAPAFRTPASDPPGQAIRICKSCGGHRVHAADNQENEVDFCSFHDGSLIDLESLYGAAKHDQR